MGENSGRFLGSQEACSAVGHWGPNSDPPRTQVHILSIFKCLRPSASFSIFAVVTSYYLKSSHMCQLSAQPDRRLPEDTPLYLLFHFPQTAVHVTQSSPPPFLPLCFGDPDIPAPSLSLPSSPCRFQELRGEKRENLHAITFTLLKHTGQWFLEHSQSCTTSPIVYFQLSTPRTPHIHQQLGPIAPDPGPWQPPQVELLGR